MNYSDAIYYMRLNGRVGIELKDGSEDAWTVSDSDWLNGAIDTYGIDNINFIEV